LSTKRFLSGHQTDLTACLVADPRPTDRFLAAVQIGDSNFRAGSLVNTLGIRPIARPAQGIDFFCHHCKQSGTDTLTQQFLE
jgi:hypothetical protein